MYSFIWETEAACPIDTSSGEHCSVKDPNSEYWFNLQPLINKTYYDVKGPNNEHFQVKYLINHTNTGTYMYHLQFFKVLVMELDESVFFHIMQCCPVVKTTATQYTGR